MKKLNQKLRLQFIKELKESITLYDEDIALYNKRKEKTDALLTKILNEETLYGSLEDREYCDLKPKELNEARTDTLYRLIKRHFIDLSSENQSALIFWLINFHKKCRKKEVGE